MNRLEGRLIRSVYKKIQGSLCEELIIHAQKLKEISYGKRTEVNIIANLLSYGLIDINDINRLGKEPWVIHRTKTVETMVCLMIGACAYGPRHEANPHLGLIQKLVSDEAATKKELNLKGWVTATESFPNYKIFIAISIGGDGFIFDGDGKCNYFIWNFSTNSFKNKSH